jgi:hypothetical protein
MLGEEDLQALAFAALLLFELAAEPLQRLTGGRRSGW